MKESTNNPSPSGVQETDGENTPRPPQPKSDRYSPEKRWSKPLVKGGTTPISNYFLEHHHELVPCITHGEAMFIIHLMLFKWDERAPFPGYKQIAKRMGVSHKSARRYAQSLEVKKYLVREKQISKTNKFHLKGLIASLEAHMVAGVSKKKEKQ